jgi:hypothetical protein
MNPRTRRLALYAIGAIAILASANALTHSYAGLYDWAAHHSLTGWQAMSWPADIDVFPAIGELRPVRRLPGRLAGPAADLALGHRLDRPGCQRRREHRPYPAPSRPPCHPPTASPPPPARSPRSRAWPSACSCSR